MKLHENEDLNVHGCFQKNRGTLKWMVKKMEHPIKMDDLGVYPYFRKHPHESFLSKKKRKTSP